MNYEIVNNNGIFQVVESQTEQLIKSFVFFRDAKEFSKKLNNGCGFSGWTPNFFLKKFKKTGQEA